MHTQCPIKTRVKAITVSTEKKFNTHQPNTSRQLLYRSGPLYIFYFKPFFFTFPKQALVFTCLEYKSFENTAGKGEIACNKQFLLFPPCFLLIWITFCHFHYNLQLSSANSFSLEE